MVEDLIKVHLGRYEASGVDLIMGEARFVAPKTVAVDLNDGGTRTITGERVILSVGTRATIPDVPGLADARPMTHVEALDLERVPDHLIVVGGGYVGLELAQAARRFGSHVTVIERGAQLAGREDPDVGAALLELFQDEEIEVLLGAEMHDASRGDPASTSACSVETDNGGASHRGDRSADRRRPDAQHTGHWTRAGRHRAGRAWICHRQRSPRDDRARRLGGRRLRRQPAVHTRRLR